MSFTLRKEETIPDFTYGVCVGAEGARSGGERSEPERRAPSGSIFGVLGTRLHDPEVPAKATRRRFSAKYKKNILQESDACKGIPGAIGSLLRREGLYSSHLTAWKKQSEKGELAGLTPKKRGRKVSHVNPLTSKVKTLESEINRLQGKLEKAETIIAFQKKLSEMLGINLEQKESDKKC